MNLNLENWLYKRGMTLLCICLVYEASTDTLLYPGRFLRSAQVLFQWDFKVTVLTLLNMRLFSALQSLLRQ